MRIFLYECICAGGLGADVPPSLQREGWAMLSAVAADFQRIPNIEVVVLLDDRLPRTLGHVCVHAPRKDEAARFREIAGRCAMTMVIAPEFDDLLESRSQIVLQVGGRLLGCSPAAIRLTADKAETADHWQVNNVPHPKTQRVKPLERPSFEPPWVLKPRRGAGSQATFLIHDDSELAAYWQTACMEWPHGDWIMQQYTPGDPASVALLLGPKQTTPLKPARQYLSSDGRFRYEGGSLPLPQYLAQRVVRLAQQAVQGIPGLKGYVGVDLVLGNRDDGSDDWAIEINPRLTTSYIGLRQSCRQNLAELMLRSVQGETIDAPAWFEREIRFRPDLPNAISAAPLSH